MPIIDKIISNAANAKKHLLNDKSDKNPFELFFLVLLVVPEVLTLLDELEVLTLLVELGVIGSLLVLEVFVSLVEVGVI